MSSSSTTDSSQVDVTLRQFDQAHLLVRVFFVVMLFFSTHLAMEGWATWRASTAIIPLWPIRWIELIPTEIAIDIIVGGVLVSCLLSVIFVENRWARLNAAVFVFFLHALINSFGKINHSWHSWLWVLFSFVLLQNNGWENIRKSKVQREQFLAVFWGAQLLVMLAYTMAGVWKVYGIFRQWQQGVVTALNPNAFAYQIANRTLETNTMGMLSEFTLTYPWIGWLPYLAAIYIETFAVVAIFRPKLHKAWALGLILFHMGTWLTMSIPFNTYLFLVGFIIWYSPFAVNPKSPLELVYELPMVKWFIVLTQWKNNARSVATDVPK